MSSGAELLVAAPLRVEAWALRSGAPGLSVLRTGMGPGRARRAGRRLGARPARMLAVAGLAGALDPALRPGTLFVATELRTAAGPVRSLEAGELAEALAAADLPVETGPLLSCVGLVRGAAQRRRLLRSGARAVDMESAWLAEAGGDRPLVVVRAIADGPDHELLRPASLYWSLLALSRLRAAAPVLRRWAGLRLG